MASVQGKQRHRDFVQVLLLTLVLQKVKAKFGIHVQEGTPVGKLDLVVSQVLKVADAKLLDLALVLVVGVAVAKLEVLVCRTPLADDVVAVAVVLRVAKVHE